MVLAFASTRPRLQRVHAVDGMDKVDKKHLFMGIPITDGVQIQWVVDSEHTDSIPNKGYRANVHKYVIGKNGLPEKRVKEKDSADYLDRKGWAFSRYSFEKPWALDEREEK